MSTYGVMRQIRQWYVDRDESAWVAGASTAELLERAEFPLTLDEATALHDRRIDWLFDAGVHAFSLVQLSRILQFDLNTRWNELGPAVVVTTGGRSNLGGRKDVQQNSAH